MPLIRNSSRRLCIGVLALVVCLLVSLFGVKAVYAAPVEWPEGWSRPIRVGQGVRSHGHRTAESGSDHMWVAMVGEQSSGISIDLRLLEVRSGTMLVHKSLPLRHTLKGYALTSHPGGAVAVWIEREEGAQSILWLASLSSDGEVSQHKLWQSDHTAENPSIAIDQDGTAYIVFATSETGPHNVYLISVDLSVIKASNPTRLTFTSELARLPVLSVGQEQLHLVYYDELLMGATAMYQLHDLRSGDLLASMVLGPVPEYHPYSPVLFSTGNAVRIVWQRMIQFPGAVSIGLPITGVLRQGQWEQPFRPVSAGQQRGTVVGVRASQSNEGSLLTTWLTQSGNNWQAYAAIESSEGNSVQAGFASLASGTATDVRPLFVGETGVVSYATITSSGLAEYSYVNTASPGRVPLAFLIGLDIHTPLQDAVFKYFTLMTGSAAMAFSAIGSLIIGLGLVIGLTRLGVFSLSTLAYYLRISILLLILVALKQPNSLLYYGAQFIPGWGTVLSWVGAFVFTISVVYLSKLELDDNLTLAAAGVLFLLCDTFTTLYVLGVDTW